MQIVEVKTLTTGDTEEHRGGRIAVSEERYCGARDNSCGGVTGVSPVQPGGDPGSPPQACGLLLLVFFFDYKVVGDGEYTGKTVDLNPGDLFLHRAGDYPFERDVPVLDDDVNGRNRAQLVWA